MRSSSGHKLYLRKVVESDLPALFQHQSDPAANQMAAFPARDRDAFMKHWTKILADEAGRAMAILLNGEVAGNVVSWEQDGKRLIGYWIAREHWGKGVASEALRAYLQTTADRPLYAFVAKHNLASIRVLEKCGFAVCEQDKGSSVEPADSVEEFLYRLDESGDNATELKN